MRNYTFMGKVIPERTQVWLKKISTKNYCFLNGEEIEFEINISIEYSLITAQALGVPDEIDLFTLKYSISNYISGAVDAIGFINGCGYGIEIDTAVDDQGNQTVFGVKRNKTNYESQKIDSSELINLSLGNIYLRRALEDLRKAIRYPLDTAFHCYRALEAIRHFFHEKEGISSHSRTEGWEKMWEYLGQKRDLIKTLEDKSKLSRHGKVENLTSKLIEELLDQTTSVIDRFILHLKN